MAIFLSAEWRYLLMVNYIVDEEVLRPYLPHGVELDLWQGSAYASMVGFLFLKTRVMGLPVPWHRNFEEVNLRFYVRKKTVDGWLRGVVFIKEIVPRRLIATVARVCYNEPYIALPMRHSLEIENETLRARSSVEYAWRHRGRWDSLRAKITGTPQTIAEGSQEEFITEHYWGYTAQPNGGCKEYRVEHPRWKVWRVEMANFDCDVAALYGEKFVESLTGAYQSAFVADGSAVTVGTGVRQ